MGYLEPCYIVATARTSFLLVPSASKETKMPIKTHKIGVLSSRAKQTVPLLDEPPLGHLQALILKKLDDLGSEAFGYNVLEQLSLQTLVWIDPSQIYSSIRRMVSEEKKYIELVEERKSPEGGPPLKIYKLSDRASRKRR